MSERKPYTTWSSRPPAVLLAGVIIAASLTGCGDEESPSDDRPNPHPPMATNAPHTADGPGDSDVSPDSSEHGTNSPDTSLSPDVSALTVRLTNGNAVQPVTVVTSDSNGSQTWWRIIEPGTAPFVELRTLPFLGVCPCSEPNCDASLPPESPQETLTLQPGESIDDLWDGMIWVRDNSAFPPCQTSQPAGPGPWRVQFTYSPGVEGEDGQIPQPTSLRSDEFRFGEDEEASLVTP